MGNYILSSPRSPPSPSSLELVPVVSSVSAASSGTFRLILRAACSGIENKRKHTFSKILEKAVQSRLSTTVHLKGLVSIHRVGPLLGASVEDTAARLMQEVHRTSQCATTGFFDIKGGSDNASHPILLDRLTSLGTPSYLVSWAGSFLSDRSITLVYLGAPSLSVPVSAGVPQANVKPPA